MSVLQLSRPVLTISLQFLRPPRFLPLGNAHATWCRGGLPRRPCLSSGNETFARGQWDCTLKAPPYHAPGYILLRSGPDETSTFRCPRPSVSLPSEQYLWVTGSAPKQGGIRSICSHKERRLDKVVKNRKSEAYWLPLRGRPPRLPLVNIFRNRAFSLVDIGPRCRQNGPSLEYRRKDCSGFAREMLKGLSTSSETISGT